MAEPEIYSNPQRLLGLAEELRTFTIGLRAELEKVDDGMGHLRSTWQDEGYLKFRRVMNQLRDKLSALDREVTTREAELKEDARLLSAVLLHQP